MLQNQYQSEYVPGVWFANYHPSPQGKAEPRTKAPSKGSDTSGVIVAIVLLVGLLTVGALAVTIYFSTAGGNDNTGRVSNTTPLDETDDTIEGYDLEIYNNPLDYRAFKAVTDNGTVTVFGPKDVNGILLLPELIEYVDEDGNKNMITLDDDGLIQAIESDNVSIQFTWSPATNSLYAVVLKTDGSIQANVNIELENVTLGNLTSPSSPSRKKRSDGASVVKRQATATYASVPVSVSDCSGPADGATVHGVAIFDYDADDFGSAIQVQGQSTGATGEYEILLPTEAASDAQEVVQEICSVVSNVVGTGCTVLSAINPPAELLICSRLATAIEILTLAVPGDGLLAFAACEAGFRGTRVACTAFNSPVDGPGPSLFDAACAAVETVVDLAVNQGQDVFLTPFATLADGQVLSTTGQVIKVVPGSSAVSTSFSIADDGSSFEVILLEANPSDPDPGENYVVTIKYNCVLQGMVTMDIMGTDSYTDEVTCLANNDCFCCVLNVPGAAALVMDIVTVQYINGDGDETATRQIVLIF